MMIKDNNFERLKSFIYVSYHYVMSSEFSSQFRMEVSLIKSITLQYKQAIKCAINFFIKKKKCTIIFFWKTFEKSILLIIKPL